MSVIAYDGKTLASDCMGVISGRMVTAHKMIKKDCGIVLAWTGIQEHGMGMAEWYIEGCNIDKFPKFQEGDDWVRLLVYDNGILGYYEQYPILQVVNDKIAAWGCGGDYAMGAMTAGKTAVEAAEIACELSPYCGKGVVSHELI